MPNLEAVPSTWIKKTKQNKTFLALAQHKLGIPNSPKLGISDLWLWEGPEHKNRLL